MLCINIWDNLKKKWHKIQWQSWILHTCWVHYKYLSHIYFELVFQEVVFLERDYLFHDLEKYIDSPSENNSFLAKLNSFSQGQFLGLIILQRDRILEMGANDRNKCFSFIKGLKLDQFLCGIFSLNEVNNELLFPEPG